MKIDVHLNAVEQSIAVFMAMGRRVAAELAGRKNKQISDRNNFDVHWMGAKAEIAFGRAYNLCPDFTYHSGRPDFQSNGQTIDIKATEHENGNLICPQAEDGKEGSSLYVLAIVKADLVSLIGYARRQELFDPANVRVLYAGGPPTHVLSPDSLHDLPQQRQQSSWTEESPA